MAACSFSSSRLCASIAFNSSLVTGGFEYSDAYLPDNDSRFTFAFIRSSMSYGCIATNYIESLGSSRKDGIWVTRVRNAISGEQFIIRLKALINACGPFVDPLNKINNEHTEHHHLFSKGIHLIVNRVTEGKKILTFFADDAYLSIFGGKLSDCINIGDEVASIVKSFGIELPYANYKWYGEPDLAIKREFMHRAELMGFDDLTPASSSGPLTTRFWRRYGRNAINMLESIREDPEKAELLI